MGHYFLDRQSMSVIVYLYLNAFGNSAQVSAAAHHNNKCRGSCDFIFSFTKHEDLETCMTRFSKSVFTISCNFYCKGKVFSANLFSVCFLGNFCASRGYTFMFKKIYNQKIQINQLKRIENHLILLLCVQEVVTHFI